jgi:hypothetical protein
MPWKYALLSDVRVGQYIKCSVFTHSQKWLSEEYEEYNRTKEGFVISVSDSPQSPSDIEMNVDDIVQVAGADPGSSGSFIIEIFEEN